jgi:hypothetical protein
MSLVKTTTSTELRVILEQNLNFLKYHDARSWFDLKLFYAPNYKIFRGQLGLIFAIKVTS